MEIGVIIFRLRTPRQNIFSCCPLAFIDFGVIGCFLTPPLLRYYFLTSQLKLKLPTELRKVANMAGKPSQIFSLEGRGLKLDTAEDLEKYIKPLREMEDLQEIRMLGNTLGVEACKALGEVLETKKTLQVRAFHFDRLEVD